MTFVEGDLPPEAWEEYRRLQTDPIYFYDKFFRIPGEEPYDYQKEIARDVAGLNPGFAKHGFPPLEEFAILKGRQIGISWLGGWLGDWFATMNEGAEVRVVAFNLKQAQYILGHAKTLMSRLKRKGLYDFFIEGQRGTNIRWHSGSFIESQGCSLPHAQNVRGGHADLLFVDEAALIYERMFPAITPLTIRTGGKTIFISTAGSVGCFFHRKWMEGIKANELRRKVARGMEIDIPIEEIPRIKSYAIPSTECPDMTEEKLLKEKRSLGEIKFNREYLNCCIPKTVLLGGKLADYIENIETGDVFGQDGRNTKITHKFKRHYSGDIVKIKATHVLPLGLTPEHPVKVGIPEKYYVGKTRKIRIKCLKWKEAQDVKVGEYLVCPKLKAPSKDIVLDLRSYIIRKQKTIPQPILSGKLKFTPKLAELLGYWIAEGSLNVNRTAAIWNYGKQELKLIERTKKLIKKIFGREPFIYKSGKKLAGTSVAFGCAALARFLDDVCDYSSGEKKLPKFMFEANAECIKRFLKAYMDGDGHLTPYSENKSRKKQIRYSEIRINSTSKILLLQIQYLLTKFNLHIPIRQSTKKRKTVIMGKEVNASDAFELFTTDPKIKRFLDIETKREKLPWTRMKEDDDYFYLRVKRITKEFYDGEVHNIETRNDTYLANNLIVHNCWAGTADQVFTKIPLFDLRKVPTRSVNSCYGGIDAGRVNDPAVLIIIEEFFAPMDVEMGGKIKNVEVPYRVIFSKSWEREHPRNIAADIATNIHPRFPVRLYTVDATGGHGDSLLAYMNELELPVRGKRVKIKSKNELMLGSGGKEGLDDAFMGEKLWINKNINDVMSEELRFELNGYIGKLQGGTGYYTFDSTVGRDHAVDALALAWSSVVDGSFDPFFVIRKQKR